MTKKVRTYSNEFKAEAVKKIADNNGNISATAKQLGIAMQTLSNWHNKAVTLPNLRHLINRIKLPD